MQGIGSNTDRTSADGGGAAAAANGGGVGVKEEEDTLLEGLDEGESAAATAAAAAAGGEKAEKDLLQSLSQDDGNAAGNAAGGSANGASAEPAAANSGSTAGAAAPGIRVRPSGPSTGDQKYAAGVAARAVQLLQQWPLLLAELAAGFAGAHPEAHAELSKVRPCILLLSYPPDHADRLPLYKLIPQRSTGATLKLYLLYKFVICVQIQFENSNLCSVVQ
jgi:hypothetical protein